MNQIDISHVYLQHKSEIVQYLYNILKHPQDAEDAAQECFIRLLHCKADVPEDRILYYLKRIARNLAMDTFRKRTRTHKRDSKLDMPAYHCDTYSLEVDEGVDELVSLVSNTEHREILKLRLIHGFSVKETAQLVHRSEGMIKSSVFHALNRIRSKIIS